MQLSSGHGKHTSQKNHPLIHSDELSPDNVLFIEYLIESGNNRASNVVHDIAHTRLGEDNIREKNTKKGGGSKITPVIRCCAGSMHMANTNKYLTDKNIGNGSRCKFKTVKLNPGT